MPTGETRPFDSGDGKPSRKYFSEDGRGGTKPIPGMKAGARYIYYRLYTKDDPLESNSPIYSNDHFISRIVSSSVRPPQTAASLMRHLCKIEGLAPQNCILFQSLSEMRGLDDSIHLSLQGTTGPGASDLDPMALVVDKRAAERRSQVTSAVEPREQFERDCEQRYVYYRLYDNDGEIVSKTSFGENNPSLGRVNTLSMPPPHTVSSLKNRIIKSEDISGHNVQLFEDEGSESAMHDSDALTLLSDTYPGFIEDQPIAITYESGMKNGSDKEDSDPNEMQTRELKEALAQIKKEFEETKLTHARELEEANRTHARELAEVREGWNNAKETHTRELEEANRTHARELAEVREGWKKAEETHARQLEEANRSHARELAENLWKTKVSKAGDALFTDAKRGDIIVPVMGPTGVGKSSFINSYLGQEKAQVGHGLKSCTAIPQPFIINLPPDESGNPRRLVLVDTPAFDHTCEADSEILRRIAVWLASSYGPGKTCGGLIYLHDMTDRHMRGRTLQSLKIFQGLCGKENLGAVVFGTTKSDKLTQEVFARREKQYSVYWKDFKEQGAIVFKLLPTHESARQLIQTVLDRVQKEQRVLRIQQELVELAKMLPETEAGKEVKYTLEETMEHQKRALAGDKLTEEQIAAHKQKIATIAPQVEQMTTNLELSFSQRLLKLSYGLGG